MKIKFPERFLDEDVEDYYPQKQKIKRKKPRKKDLDGGEEDRIIKSNKK